MVVCSPPPVPEPDYQVFVNKPSLVQEYQSPSPLKNLDESSQFVEKIEAVITFTDDGKIEEHELKVTTKNLASGSFYNKYGFSFTLSEGHILEVLSNTCNKVSNKNSSDVDCTPSYQNEGSKHQFEYNYKLFDDEYITIKYKYKIVKPKEILYRQEAFSISEYKEATFCTFKFIIPSQYTSLGLKDNFLTKTSDNEYSYNECPTAVIKDVIRFTPKESYWKANVGIYLKSQSKITDDVTVFVTFPRYYKGGKNTNKFYKLMTKDNNSLEESDYIHNEINLKLSLPGNNKKNLGIEVNTAFTNKLNSDFSVYASEELYKLDQNIDEEIKTKAQEIMNDGSSEPLYKKIGKFVNSHIIYNLDFHGEDLTASQIYQQKQGVCKHYTILYNAMLNAVGIKTLKIFGWAFQKEETTANEKTIGHAWTAALIDGKWIELDATWGLFDGIPSGHILKGYDKETVSYSYTSSTLGLKFELLKTHNIQLVSNLDNEKEEDINYIGIGAEEDEDEEEGESKESSSESHEKTNTEESKSNTEESNSNTEESKSNTEESNGKNDEKGDEEKKENKSNSIKFKKLLNFITFLYFLL